VIIFVHRTTCAASQSAWESIISYIFLFHSSQSSKHSKGYPLWMKEDVNRSGLSSLTIYLDVCHRRWFVGLKDQRIWKVLLSGQDSIVYHYRLWIQDYHLAISILFTFICWSIRICVHMIAKQRFRLMTAQLSFERK
jgi:hypothetical protein